MVFSVEVNIFYTRLHLGGQNGLPLFREPGVRSLNRTSIRKKLRIGPGMAINLKLLNEEIENSRPIRTNRFVRTNFKVGNDDLRKLLVALKRADSIRY